jgi:ribosomal protein S4
LIINKHKIQIYLYIYMYMYKFFKKILQPSKDCLGLVKSFQKKKNLFFKKKFRIRILVYRRLSFALRRRKRNTKFRVRQKSDKGRFFFKKFFFKTLLRNRKSLKSFFFFNKKTRQSKLTKEIFKNKNKNYNNSTFEYTILNILLRSNFCVFFADAKLFIRNNCVYVNGVSYNDLNYVLNKGDCLQLKVSKMMYRYVHQSKKFLKKKIALFRYNLWKFYKQKNYKSQSEPTLKQKKKRTPKHFYIFFLFKLDSPKFLEIDFLTLSVLFIIKYDFFRFSSYYLNKFFSFKLFSLYNYKKIN